MMMMQMTGLNEFNAQLDTVEVKVDNQSIENSSFNKAFDQKINDVTNHERSENVEESSSSETEVKDDLKTSEETKVESKESEKESKSEDIKSEKKFDDVESKKSDESGNKENNVDENSKSDIKEDGNNPLKDSLVQKSSNKDLEIKKSEKKINSGEKTKVKTTDKDELNQSIAGAEHLTQENPKTEEVIISEISGDDDTLVKLSEGVNENSSVDSKKAASQMVTNQNLETKSKGKQKLTDKKAEKTDKRIKVTDLRTEKSDSKLKVVQADTKSNDAAKEVKFSDMVDADGVESVEAGSDKNIVLGTTELSAEGQGGKAQAPVMKEASTVLKQQLKDFGNNEIVKQSKFVLKDNNVGEIKLILKPEALGQVKINLNLNENSLAGQIVVENNSVKEVFQENMQQLTKALEEQGFENTELDISLNDRDGDKRDQQDKPKKQYYSDRLRRFEESNANGRYSSFTTGIDLTA